MSKVVAPSPCNCKLGENPLTRVMVFAEDGYPTDDSGHLSCRKGEMVDTKPVCTLATYQDRRAEGAYMSPTSEITADQIKIVCHAERCKNIDR